MRVKAVKDGAVDFVQKPYREQQLLDAIDEALRRNAAHRAPAGDEIGSVTGIEFKGGHFKAVAEPNRRGGGSAKVVTPDPTNP